MSSPSKSAGQGFDLPSATSWLERVNATVELSLHQCEGARIVSSDKLDASTSGWAVSLESSIGSEDSLEACLSVSRSGDRVEEQLVSLDFHFEDWSCEHYLFAPACLYNGNRYEAIPIQYPPQVEKPEHMGVDAPMVITDVPRLNVGAGESRLDMLAGDCSTPVVGVYDARNHKGFLIFYDAFSELGSAGFSFEENESRDCACLRLKFPGLREGTRYYRFSTTAHPSPDRGACYDAGDGFEARVKCYHFEAQDIHAFYEKFFEHRKCLLSGGLSPHEYSFSQTFATLQAKYNRENWREEPGFYRVGVKDHAHHDFQTGWVGGAINSFPLLVAGEEGSRERSRKTVDFLLTQMQAPSGLFYGVYYKGDYLGDCFKDHHAPWHLLRKSADALYFAFKHIAQWEREDPSWQMPQGWRSAFSACADAFVKLWREHAQLGQFINHDTGEIIVGNSLSAGIAPAGLALASQYLDNAEYLAVAQECARGLFEQYADEGISNGGPGEIAQCPDSESAFGFLESLVVLYEFTGEADWLARAEKMAWQCASWCMSYDYPFPEHSALGRYGVKSTGSVWANVQNKHSSPGICTLSGNALFKLYRATGNVAYLDLLAEIAHNITQYLSRSEKPIMAPAKREGDNILEYAPMPEGWMNERVQTSDWLEPQGEVFSGSTWAEVACLLTAVEVPGLYWQSDTGYFKAIDHVNVSASGGAAVPQTLLVENPTASALELRVFVETGEQAHESLKEDLIGRMRVYRIEAGETLELSPS